MKIEKLRFRAVLLTGLALSVGAFAGRQTVAGFPPGIDWDGAREFAPGMRIVSCRLDAPREMAAWFVRIDLTTPGLRATGSGRVANYGDPMPDVTNRVVAIETEREKTQSFLERYRAGGTNMVLAVNTSPWKPWERPFTHRYANVTGFAVSDGITVSDGAFGPSMIVIRRDGTAIVTNALDRMRVGDYAVAHPGFGTILRGGVALAKPTQPKKMPVLAPRTALGVSADGRILYVLIVDGRQKGYSMGADMAELAQLLKAAGAVDGINVDGGGSTTLVRFEGGKVVTDNRHDAAGRHYRPVALNLGFYYEEMN